jgi:hypothetical protein
MPCFCRPDNPHGRIWTVGAKAIWADVSGVNSDMEIFLGILAIVGSPILARVNIRVSANVQAAGPRRQSFDRIEIARFSVF